MKNIDDRTYWNAPNGAHRRVMYKGAGFNNKDIKTKFHIGIANAFMEGSPGSAHLRTITESIKQGVWEAGGMPIEFGIPCTCGNVSNGAEELKYELVGRDIVSMSIEFVTQVHHFDALILVASCDNIIAGTYLAAARLDLPTLVVTGGPMMPGVYKGKKVLAPDVDIAILAGDNKDLSDMEECVCPSFGACSVMGTANTMQILGETLNLVLPGTATIPAADLIKLRSARDAGRYIIELINKGLTPSKLITKETLLNTIMVDMAIGGSTNAVLHILSIARDLDIDITLDDFDRLSEEIKCICGVRPSGPYNVVDLHNEGGVPAVMKMLEKKLNKNVLTLLGNTWEDILKNIEVESSDVLRPLENPLHKDSGLKVLKGNLAPKGAIIRPSGVYEDMKYFRGVAKVFSNDFEALKAIQDGKIFAGDVIVIRYEGCKGAPGMKEVMLSTDALVAFGLDKSVGLVTDARFSGFNYGAIVGHVCPEAYDGGPIALVENGDMIVVDVKNGIIEVEISDEELDKRYKNWVRPEPKVKKGVLAVYASTCRTADEGGAMQTW
ncbi:dihydroxy-acid dehydratase [Paraclostridium sordellii]|uniref:dihydroxy-acid dehydratase n=1 Tax=Paraclostridium sordellii TaxID=1505 RepID=UPI0005DC6D8E|nr:dihydroxy-acid dehydratase [Paeniclostridium sordellii]MDU6482280.1 dihydroxy-acid dehydratase [Paeniclostridium sordellii]CEN25824.1 dihydroxy-acid dehydratase IlvD [[Clostridium] sordellii] [Paeniclostridium sordellii]CEN29953.1 dihydroxy-acid dehydratase IlvD [[Clostridium] sordellii] [Paeniclostridium sordellii]CEN30767.1 dihydroxy-acid dehydratase IlvD [[Clostridium] sordellii] [Paeniclostridium sordellii]CEP46451.1 dihydroxy-acid dehydratase IlvD [[Clostridium] sordellii] [Paeniclostr